VLLGRSLGGAGEAPSSPIGTGDHGGGAVDETGSGGGGGGGYVAVVYTSAPSLAGIYSEIQSEIQSEIHRESGLRDPSPLWRSLTALTKPPGGSGGGGRAAADGTAGGSLSHNGAADPGQRAAGVIGTVDSLDEQFAAWAARTTPPAQQAAPAAYAAPRERAERHAPAQRRLAFTSSP
jgi:hypothetical protein